jgi:polyhydroxyalkanoate synthesis repressor PhaR
LAKSPEQSESATREAPIRIKKYANRRLYNTASSSYVTLENLAQMVKDGVEFVVTDAKSGDDITRSVLTQIIFEEESKGQSLLPLGFLRQLIGLYGDSLQTMVPGYLEMSMQAFSRNQEQMRHYMNETFGDLFPFRQLEEIGRQNMTMFEQAMKMFQPPQADDGGGAGQTAPAADGDELARLREQLQEMQRNLDRLASKK